MARMSVKQLDESVLKDLYLNGEYNLGKQFYDAFPASMTVNGIEINLRDIHGKLPEIYWWYGRSINFNLKLHNRIMKALEYAKANNLLHSPLSTFLRSGWQSIEYYMNHPEEF